MNSAVPRSDVLAPPTTREAGFFPPYPIAACLLVFFWSLFARSLLYTIMPTIAADLQLSGTVAGSVIAVMLLGNCAGQWTGGWLPFSRKKRVIVGTLLSLPASMLVATAGSLNVLFVAAFLLGFTSGIYLPLGISMVVDYGGANRRARFMAFHEMSGTISTFAGSASLAVILTWTGWREAMFASCAVGLLAVTVFSRVKDLKDRHHVDAKPRKRIPLDSRIVYSILAQVSMSILLMGLISVLPLIMVRAWGLSQVEAAAAVGYTRLGGIAGVLVVGSFGDRWGHRQAVTGAQLVSLIATIMMCVSGYGPMFLAGMTLLSAGAVGTSTVLALVISAAFSSSERESALGTNGSVGGLIGLVGAPALFGALIDASLPSGPMFVAAASTVVAVLATRKIVPRKSG